ncbi:nuclear transport factor 2 family protein [Halorientalis pallida]|uniref:nuclear transport factor 2 family protein n=1 Tax=Halorientalis pallida TaxID=2479928 RepID=UPI003C6F22D7
MDREATAREYYRTLDEDDYETLADLLAPEFVHYRPDRTIEGRDRFVTFMRDERPMKATSHPLDAVYATAPERGESEIAVRGRLLDPDGEPVVSFVDVFAFDGENVQSIHTYTQ